MQEKRQNIDVIKQRILEYAEYKGITAAEICKKSGISEGLLKGSGLNSELGGGKIVKILSYYQDIDANWLLKGIKETSPFNTNTINEPKQKYFTMNCNDCPYFHDMNRYHEDVIRYRKEIDYLNKKLSELRDQNQSQGKRHSA